MKTIDLMIKSEDGLVSKFTFILKEIQCFTFNKVYVKNRAEPFLIDMASNRKLNALKKDLENE